MLVAFVWRHTDRLLGHAAALADSKAGSGAGLLALAVVPLSCLHMWAHAWYVLCVTCCRVDARVAH